MNKKIIATLTVGAISMAGITSAFANSTSNNSQNIANTSKIEGKNFGKNSTGKMMKNITPEEMEKLNSMTSEEKQAFFEAKKSENKAKIQERENVIDKLLSGETLTAEEEKIRQEIITMRLERKAKMSEANSGKTLKKT